MIAMSVDRPLREHHIWFLRFEDFLERIMVRRVHYRFAVELTGIRRDAPSRSRTLSPPPPFVLAPCPRWAFHITGIAAVEIKQDHFVSQRCVPCNCSAATILRIAGMSARYDDLEFAPGRLRRGTARAQLQQPRVRPLASTSGVKPCDQPAPLLTSLARRVALTWRTLLSVPRSHSCERLFSFITLCSQECEHRTHECVRHAVSDGREGLGARAENQSRLLT